MQTPLYRLFAFPWYSSFCHLLIGASKSNQDWSGKSVPTHKKVKHVTQFTCFDVYCFARFESSSFCCRVDVHSIYFLLQGVRQRLFQ